MQLNELASQLATSRVVGDGTTIITGIEIDSRKVKPGDLFVCVSAKNGIEDRHHYAAQAINAGAVAIVVEHDVESNVPKLFVSNTWDALAAISCHFYNYPSKELKLIGVTGTNGKTTTTYLLEKLLSSQGFATGLMGNIEIKIGSASIINKGSNTQEAYDLQNYLRQMADQHMDYCMMEVSSHGLDMGRVKGCNFRTAIFTNLTQDHLDYHGSMEAYKAAKGLLFSRLGNEYSSSPHEQKYAVLNADDPAAEDFGKLTSAQVITYGIINKANVRAEGIRITAQGTSFRCVTFRGTVDIQTQLIGEFNVYNVLAAISAALLEGIPLEAIKQRLAFNTVVEGRMEVVDAGQDFLLIVDYAHTPDGLDKALSTISQFVEGRIHCVFGCGGDRDRTKRPLMGQVAARYSDFLYVTSDNPRMENPQSILQDIVEGLLEVDFPTDKYELIADRKAAIHLAISRALPGDVVLIAGKGHETYQDINGTKHDFDDRLVAENAIRGRYLD
ncbi:UDP-N-acetylmuramoyl-L-alanyl-D-glutamate--2,6-diaminopimelate ligase [Paenibacillus agricola]|uniref:UDP-N-acetylmuramoyl-L-alanyl-D-glutamate--2,6-diaminopimelate ligase n=1 Tax=Paenibacillus agricola TaxID=2716264 RepID=A0ABX0J196_9BACL|nr:UDP-N-acetylmuramoyl-L-alanyl-D-glutamate--2,6-diaminopimelate ligase [Paenibacillus agricola]NHN28662.1 UDP-N-acetylmuramoyl-L-alanyl-D-glutamate--2,6-diaminopimelate ligase [Paenibacillus agricola]